MLKRFLKESGAVMLAGFFSITILTLSDRITSAQILLASIVIFGAMLLSLILWVLRECKIADERNEGKDGK